MSRLLDEAVRRAKLPKKTKQLSMRLRPAHYDAIQKAADVAGVSMNSIITHLIEAALDDQPATLWDAVFRKERP